MYGAFRYLRPLAAVTTTLQFLAGRDELFPAIDVGVSANVLPLPLGSVAPISVLAVGSIWIGLVDDSTVAIVIGAFLVPIGVLQFVLSYARRIGRAR